MRMWMINPSLLCNKHLLGEHVELHMLVGCIRKRKNLRGYINKGLVQLNSINKRHDEIVVEMWNRGFNHKSPLVCAVNSVDGGVVDVDKSIVDLVSRCENCRERIKNE